MRWHCEISRRLCNTNYICKCWWCELQSTNTGDLGLFFFPFFLICYLQVLLGNRKTNTIFRLVEFEVRRKLDCLMWPPCNQRQLNFTPCMDPGNLCLCKAPFLKDIQMWPEETEKWRNHLSIQSLFQSSWLLKICASCDLSISGFIFKQSVLHILFFVRQKRV